MHNNQLTVALLSEIFSDRNDEERFTKRLKEARCQGAELVLLPELPYNQWSPATPHPNPLDAEPVGGWRETMQNRSAYAAKIAVLGGIIRVEETTRLNMALLSDASGKTVAHYAKVHLPDEEGFKEPCHYESGKVLPRVISLSAARLGIQICSDANRLAGSHMLAAQGVQVILAPRATNEASWDRWQLVYRAMALTCATWVISVGRPKPEFGVPLGGPSLIVDPLGTVVLETRDPLAVFYA